MPTLEESSPGFRLSPVFAVSPPRSGCIILPYAFPLSLSRDPEPPAIEQLHSCSALSLSLLSISLKRFFFLFSLAIPRHLLWREKKYATFTNRTQQKVEVISGSLGSFRSQIVNRYKIARCLVIKLYCKLLK